MSEPILIIETEPSGLVWLRMNRPDRRNAFDDEMIDALSEGFTAVAQDTEVRAVALTGAGNAFSAGADLGWMQRMAGYSHDENREDAVSLAEMLHLIATCPKPVIAAVNGPAIAGGAGLVAAADIAIGTPDAVFAITEVRLGLTPATISPYLLAAIGARAARRYVLTAERFDAATARDLGLLHEIVPAGKLAERVRALAEALAEAGPVALEAAKKLIRDVGTRAPDKALRAETAERIAAIRVSPEGREGIAAFLEKRTPAWSRKGRPGKDQGPT
ncbi:MAG: enoyl-CoA hydratase/isomerase family protein [Alphaproteobacteria bacterium]|nr:enoyl-CoA hydratase/isomerase family protein [Alphaproteobacteria bacterium]